MKKEQTKKRKKRSMSIDRANQLLTPKTAEIEDLQDAYERAISAGMSEKQADYALDTIMAYTGDFAEVQARAETTADEMADTLLGLDFKSEHIEICGTWVWLHVSEENITESARAAIEHLNFKYAAKKQKFYWSPATHVFKNGKKKYKGVVPHQKIQEKYGSKNPKREED